MTYFLGLIGVLQMMFIPGLILYRILNEVARKNFWIHLPLILSLSFIFNYFLVIGLTTFQVYLPHILRSIIVVEVLILLLCYPRFWALPLTTQQRNLKLFSQVKGMDKKYTQWYFLIFFLLLGMWVFLWLHSFGIVFGMRDPTVSYNIWAIAWSQNQFPTLTWHYPQLLTTNWSIPYVMMGTLPNHVVLEMFPASLNLLFPILFMIMFFELFKAEHNRAYLFAGIAVSLFMLSDWKYIHNGSMDWVCAFLNLLSLKLIYQLSGHGKHPFSWRAYLQIILVVAAAALVKPAGITTLVLAPLLMVALVRFDNKRPEILLFYSYLLLVLLVAPWYIYAEYHETLPGHTMDLLFLIWGIFRYNSWLFFFTEILFYGWVALTLLLACFFFSKSLPRFWRFVFYFYSPYFFIWACFYSYDGRNLAFILPVLSTCLGLIVAHHKIDMGIMNFVKPRLHKLNQLWILLLALVLVAEFKFLDAPWYRGHLIQHEITTKNQIFDYRPGVIALKEYAQCQGFTGKILDPMLVFGTLPMFSPYIVQLPNNYFGANMLPQTFEDPLMLQRTLVAYPKVRYFLFDMNFLKLVSNKATRNLLENWLDTGKIKAVMHNNNIVLYEIMVPLAQLNFSVPLQNSEKMVK